MPDAEAKNFGLCDCELCLEDFNLVLESGNGSDAAVDWVPEPRVGLVDHATHGIAPVLFR